MAKNETRMITLATIAADEAAAVAVQEIPDYAPVKPALSKERLAASLAAWKAAQQAETRAEQALASAHDDAVAAVWEFHNLVLSVKAQVEAQYGPNSNELQSLGIKKKSEYKTPARRKPASAA
jgi:hypothetical protein